MNLQRALLAGALGGTVMSILTFLARLGGVDVSLEMLLGTSVLAPGVLAWILGFGMHVLLSALIALAYAWGFETVTKRANAGLGVAFGVVHALVAGVVLYALVPTVHRLIPGSMEGPASAFADHGALGIVASLVPHLVYGAIVGTMYADQVRRPRLTAGL